MRYFNSAILLSAVVVTPCGAAVPGVTHATVCPTARRSAEPSPAAEPPAGIPLLFGVVTGMTEADVERIAPGLRRGSFQGRFELLPGVRQPAQVFFEGELPRANGITLRGRMDYRRIADRFTRSYGRPIDLGSASFLNIYRNSAVTPVERVDLQWCDGRRKIRLGGRSDDFFVTVSILPE